MEQIREKIAEELAEPTTIEMNFPVGADPSAFPLTANYLEKADQILNLTLRRGGGVCPMCNGTRKIKYAINDTARRMVEEACTYCKTTGELPVEEKSIGEIIEWWYSQP